MTGARKSWYLPSRIRYSALSFVKKRRICTKCDFRMSYLMESPVSSDMQVVTWQYVSNDIETVQSSFQLQTSSVLIRTHVSSFAHDVLVVYCKVLQTRGSRNGHSDFIPLSCDETVSWVCDVCVISVWDFGDTREDDYIWTRSVVCIRRNRNVRKLGQIMKMTTTLRDDDTTGHGRARTDVGVCRSYGEKKRYWWGFWKTSFPNTLIGTDQKYRMSCGNLSSVRFRTVLSLTFRWSCRRNTIYVVDRVDLKHFVSSQILGSWQADLYHIVVDQFWVDLSSLNVISLHLSSLS